MLSRSARAETRQSSRREVKRVMHSEDKVMMTMVVMLMVMMMLMMMGIENFPQIIQ